MLVNVYADKISLVSQISTIPRKDSTEIHITTTNTGDNIAGDVQFAVEIAEYKKKSSIYTRIRPHEKLTWQFALQQVFPSPLHTPIILRTNYKDQIGRKFNSVHVSDLSTEQATATPIYAQGDTEYFLDIQKPISNAIQLTNKLSQPITLKLRAIHSEDIAIRLPQSEVTLPSHTPVSISFTSQNITATPGSRYTAFFLMEYELNNAPSFSIQHILFNVSHNKLFWGISSSSFYYTGGGLIFCSLLCSIFSFLISRRTYQ